MVKLGALLATKQANDKRRHSREPSRHRHPGVEVHHSDPAHESSTPDPEKKEDALVQQPAPEEAGPLEVQLSVTVQYLGSIDNVAQSFYGRLHIDVWWAPTAQELQQRPDEPLDFDILNKLQLVTATSVDNIELKNVRLKDDVGGEIMWHATVEASATFHNTLDLRRFPFDCQCLEIKMEMGNAKKEVYAPAKHMSSIASLETHLCPLMEWRVAGMSCAYTASDAALSKQGNRYSQCIIHIAVARHWEPYAMRLLVVMLFLGASTLSTYAIPVDEVADRLGFVFTILLTSVAFQFTVADKLPQAPYLTFFDQYVIMIYILQFLMVAQVSVAPTAISDWGWDDFDQVAMYFSLACVVLIHAVALVLSFTNRSKALAGMFAMAEMNEGPANLKCPNGVYEGLDTSFRVMAEES